MTPKHLSSQNEGVKLLRLGIQKLRQRIEHLTELPPEKRDWAGLSASMKAIDNNPNWKYSGDKQPLKEVENLGRRLLAVLDGLLETTERDNPAAKALHLRTYSLIGLALLVGEQPDVGAIFREGLRRLKAYLAKHPDHAGLQVQVLSLYGNAGAAESHLRRLSDALCYCIGPVWST